MKTAPGFTWNRFTAIVIGLMLALPFLCASIVQGFFLWLANTLDSLAEE